MGERVKDGTKSEGRAVMARIGDETMAPRRKSADLFLVTIARELWNFSLEDKANDCIKKH
jgi:hypothetical protein